MGAKNYEPPGLTLSLGQEESLFRRRFSPHAMVEDSYCNRKVH
jgi:hypothetical protein